MKKILSLFFAALLLLLPMIPAGAAESDLPSLFCGDEPWYKDTVSPLVVRNGIYYVPAEMCRMFEGIEVNTPTEDNLLVHNRLTGDYISILFRDRSAAMNGRIITGVNVMRDSGVYYVDVSLLCRAVGLTVDYYTTEDGRELLRLRDKTDSISFEELIKRELESYEEAPAGNGKPEEPDPRPTLYLICSSKDGYSPYSAREILTDSRLPHTVLLDEFEPTEAALANRQGAYGVSAGIAAMSLSGELLIDRLDTLSAELCTMTKVKARFTLSTGDPVKDRSLTEAGYFPIVPDVNVNGGVRAESVYKTIMEQLRAGEDCVVYLEDCWNSARIVELLTNEDDESFALANIAFGN